MTDMVFRRRRLPHQDVSGHSFFITACLEGSLPAVGLSRIKRYRTQLERQPCPKEMTLFEWEEEQRKRLFAFVDELLDNHSPVCHLSDERQAQIVQNALLHFAGTRYELLSFVIMPSHMHWHFLPIESWAIDAVQRSGAAGSRRRTAREIISHSVQSYTATMCNRVRGVSGNYWQHETFDHWARDEAQSIRITNYIENNPVRAGLVAQPHEYGWSSARIRKVLGLPQYAPIPNRW